MIALQKIDHPKCACIKGLFEGESRIYIVMEYVEEGDLNNFFVSNKGMTKDASTHILKQLLDVLKYLHDTMGIVHRDLKLENMLVEKFDLDQH